jgi:hypothetical protein
MKAALEAWGADSNLFHQGAAKQSEDPDVVAATMAKPGVMLKRPVGSNGPFKEHAELPFLQLGLYENVHLLQPRHWYQGGHQAARPRAHFRFLGATRIWNREG